MTEILSTPPPWYVAGLGIGLVVVALLAAMNERLGVVGGYADVVERIAERRPRQLGWKGFFLIGIVAGGLLFRLLGGGERVGDEYGWLTRTFTGDARVAVAVVLAAAGALIGYGAKTAGGCTSGNGLSGTSLGSAASLVATITFMATAVATALATELALGAR